jgi:hypothetical protein
MGMGGGVCIFCIMEVDIGVYIISIMNLDIDVYIATIIIMDNGVNSQYYGHRYRIYM